MHMENATSMMMGNCREEGEKGVSLRFWLGPADDTNVYWLWETSSPSAHGEEWVRPSRLQQSCPGTGQWSPGESQVNLILINIYDSILRLIMMTSLVFFSPQWWDKELTFKGSYNAKLPLSALVNMHIWVGSRSQRWWTRSDGVANAQMWTRDSRGPIYCTHYVAANIICVCVTFNNKAAVKNPANVWATWIGWRCLIGSPHAIKTPLLPPHKGSIMIVSSTRSIATICVDSSPRFLGDGPDRSGQHCSLGWGDRREIRTAQLTVQQAAGTVAPL